MEYNNTVKKQPDGYYYFPQDKQYPYKTKNLRDPYIKQIIDEIKKNNSKQVADELLEYWGYVNRDDKGNYAKVPEQFSVLNSDEELDAKQKFANLVNKSEQFTLDPNEISTNALTELLRNLPRNKQYLITQGATTYTMNDKIRNEVVHELIAHQRITETNSENWIVSTVVGGQPFTVSEHVVQKIGYAFKDPGFFNWLFKMDIDDDFVKLFEIYQIFKTLPDFTAYTSAGVDNKNHFGEHYCCLINSLIQLGCDGSVLLQARTCITGLHVPKSSLKEFCNIAKIKIKLYWYEKKTKQKQLKNQDMWDKTNEWLKNAPLFEIGIIDNHYIPYLNTDISKYAIQNYEKVKSKTNWWLPAKKQRTKGKNILWVLDEMLQRKDQFFREIPIDDAHMATLHYGSKKNLEFEGETYDAPQFTAEQMKKANDARKWVLIYKHILSCDELTQIKLFIKNGFEQKETYSKKLGRNVKSVKWTRDPKSNRIPDDFSYHACFTSTKKALTIAWDTETTTDGDFHKRYASNCYCPEHKSKQFETERDMLNYFKNEGVKDLNIYAHNAKYDCHSSDQGILSCLIRQHRCELDGSMIFITGEFYGMKVKIVDSFKFISAKLEDTPEMFKLEDLDKEIMPYNIFNEANMFGFEKGTKVPIEVIKNIEIGKFKWNKKKQKQFELNLEKWNCISEDRQTVDLLKYANHYCDRDCLLLYRAMAKFRENIYAISQLDILTLTTAASIGEAIMHKNGAFDDVVVCTGVVRDFIQRCVVGGRVCVSNNEAKVVHGKIADLDGVSLYPSAIYRLKGYPKGSAKGIQQALLNDQQALKLFLKDKDMYYLRVRITKVSKHYATPLISYINEKGTRCWDDTEAVGQIIYMDKIGLEGMQTFHGMEYEILAGYYYNEGFNPKVCEVIKELFQARLEMKQENNPIEQQYKLILNSAYGKTLLKARDYESKYIPNAEKDQYLKRHYNSIRRMYPCGNDMHKFVLTKPVLDHENFVHCGVNVLSMSKQIMMEVTSIAEDLGSECYYTDTDSIHVDFDAIPHICTGYKEEYKKELYGENLGQFNNDHKIKVKLSNGKTSKCTDVYAVSCWLLGKKLYTDLIVGTHPETGEQVQEWHIRGKGFPTDAIWYHCEQYGVNPGELAQRIFDQDFLKPNEKKDGELIDCLCDGNRQSFEHTKQDTVRFRSRMVRSMRCVRGKTHLEPNSSVLTSEIQNYKKKTEKKVYNFN